MYIYGGSGVGRYTSLTNDAWDFSISVPNNLEITPNGWSLSLAELRIQREAHTEGHFALFADVVAPQPFYGEMKPILRTFELERRDTNGGEVIDHIVFTDRYYIPVHTRSINWLRISLKSIDGNSERDLIKTCCVFHLKRR